MEPVKQYDFEAYRVEIYRQVHGSAGVLIGPPDAGHGPEVMDFGPGQSIIQEALDNTTGTVAAIIWKSATYDRRNESIEDKVNFTLAAIKLTGCAHLIGLCQAGWLFARVASQHPGMVWSLTLAGTPIDTSLGESSLVKAQEMPLSYYKWVVAMNGGIMPGWLMNACWKSANPKMHYFDRFVSPSERSTRFYEWYDKTQNLSGGWYLEIMEELFINNTFKDTLLIKCPVTAIVGATDDITPPEQTTAIANSMHGGFTLPVFTVYAGHLGVFTARKAMPIWAEVFGRIK